MNQTERLKMIARPHEHYSTAKQCALLKIARSTVYYKPKPISDADLKLMKRIDEIYLKWPFYGSRRMVAELRGEGHVINRKHVRRLMRLMGIEAIPAFAGTSLPKTKHQSRASKPQEIPVFTEESCHHTRQSGVVRRHHVHSDEAGICVSGRGDGLVQSQRSVVENVDHNGHGFLC
jgi:hypothetical protein